jgi:hypothetical protein
MNDSSTASKTDELTTTPGESNHGLRVKTGVRAGAMQAYLYATGQKTGAIKGSTSGSGQTSGSG